LFATVLIASCGGAGDESSSGRLRNAATNCFPTLGDRISALGVATAAANAAEANLASKGDEQVLTTAFSTADTEYQAIRQQFMEADRSKSELFIRHLNKEVPAIDFMEAAEEVNRLHPLLVQAHQKLQAAQQALDAYQSAKASADLARNQLTVADATPVCVVAEASATSVVETSVVAPEETATSVALETSTTIDGSTETTLLADENSATTIEVVPTTAVSDQATVEDASTTTAPSTTIANATSESCTDGTVLTPPAEVVVGEKFWVGLQGCTNEIQERTGQVFHLGHSAALNCPSSAVSLNGIDGIYFECSLTVAGPETLIPWIAKPSESKKIKEFPFITVIARDPGGDVCRGQSPDGEIDMESRTVSVRYTCEKSTGLRIQALCDTPTGTAVVGTWLNSRSRQFNNLNIGYVL